jgi:ATP-dependent RNA helicase DDX5/DBP2
MAQTLFTKQDGRYAKELVRILGDADQEVSPELQQLAANGGGGGGGMPWRGGGGRGGGGRGGGGRGGGRGGGFQKKW